jgi:hypothetical protein
MKKLLIFALSALFCGNVSAQRTSYSLASDVKGVEWTLAPQAEVSDGGKAISQPGYQLKGTDMGAVKAVVPGVVFASYVAAGKEECPEYADNIYRVDETKYNRPFWYRAEFDMPQQVKAGQHVWLCFDNTNKYADFYFNGHKVSGTEESTRDTKGHMMRTRLDVTEFVNKTGKNAIAVLITDVDQKKTRTDKGPYGVACSPSYLAGAGWDWMPYVPGRLNGIPGKCSLDITGDVVMEDPWVRSYLPTLDEAQLTIQSDLKNVSGETQKVTFRGTIMPGNIKFEKTVEVGTEHIGRVKIDRNDFKELAVKNPKLWWPNGYGDPFLYQAKLEVVVNGTVTDTKTVDFGIRKFEYRWDKNKVDMPVLCVLCNGQRIFMKGGNWGMSEYLLRYHNEDYEKAIRLHHEMNYNTIRLWTGCVTDDEFYDYCDKYGILVWTDFWLYVAWNDVAEHDVFLANARDKVRRLRNHASIAVWCGANECRPVSDLDKGCEMIVMEEDGNDRLYTSCSNQDGKSGSGWWKDFPPKHHFETSASNLAFNNPSYPYGIDYGYGFRSEIGMATFPTYESTRLFIPKKDQWPLPSDEALKDSDNTVYNKHFFGKEAWNGGPIDYVHSVNDRYGECKSLEEFCEKAQLINLEDMKGMYEAWNDKMWNDATALIIWMSHPAYPSFVWQTYDYYLDPTGCYWGAKQACKAQHVQWNCLDNSVKVINTTARPLNNVRVKAHIYNIGGTEVASQSSNAVSVESSNIKEALKLQLPSDQSMIFIRLELISADGKTIDSNFYWFNAQKEYDYTALNNLPEAKVTCQASAVSDGKFTVTLKNNSQTVAFAERIRLVNRNTGERILPAIMSDGYVTLLPGESRTVSVEAPVDQMEGGVKVLLKQYGKKEKVGATIK